MLASTKKFKYFSLFGFLIIFALLLWFLFSHDNFYIIKEIFNSNATKEQIRDSINQLGVRPYIVVLILSMLQVILTFIPAEPLHVIAGVSFGLWKGILVCLVGIILGNTIIFLLYKIFGKKLTDYFATNVEFDFSIASKSNKIALIVILLYCLPAIPYGIICFFAASMGMKYTKYIVITGIGSIPSLVLDVGLGHLAISASWTISLIVFVAIIILLIVVYKFKKQIFSMINEYMRISQEKVKNKVGNYNPFVYSLSTFFCINAIKRKVKMKINNNIGKFEKPSIILCNHGSFFDFVYAGRILKKYKPHFIVARMYFHHKLLSWIIRSTGAFPKSMYTSDIDNVKNCLKVINSGEMLAMMPEARLSTIGKFEGIQDATYKFIQKMNVPVYTINIKGAYLARPKWSDGIRKGARVEVEVNKLFDNKELEKLTLDEVKQAIDTSLNYDEWKWLEDRPEIRYKHKTIAEGLENILSICPKCGEKYTLETMNNLIMCSHCGNSVVVDYRYNLEGVRFKNIVEWYEWQVNKCAEEIKTSKDFKLESKVELRHLSQNGKGTTRHSGYGVCTYSKEGLRYIGTEDGKEIDKIFAIENIHRLLFGAGEDFEIYEGKELYYFVPEEKRSAITWYLVSGILNKYNRRL